MPGEKSKNGLSLSPSERFRRDVHYVILDAIINSIKMRFKDF